jgi:Protein of unknown function (DUF1761)
MEGNPMDAVNWLAVLAATVSMFVLGALWYGPLFGKAWMRASGITEEQARQANMAKVFGLSFVLTLLAAFALAMFIGPEATAGFGVFAGFMTGAFFIATAMGVVYLFEQRPFALWAIDSGYHIVGFTIMGAILGAW